MPKVALIAYYFPPLGGGPVQRPQKFVQFLPAEGFLPLVITGPLKATKEFSSGMDTTLMATIPSGVEVHRTEGPVPGRGGKWRYRLVRWLGLRPPFADWWIRTATELTCKAAADASVIFATMDPFESADVASEASRRLGIPWVADLRDPWALDEMQRYPTVLHRKLEMARMEKALSTAAVIIMNTPEAAAALKRAYPKLRGKKILSITNGFDREEFAGVVPQRTDSKFRVVHSGAMWTGPAMHLQRRRFSRLLGGVKSGFDLSTRSHIFLMQAVEKWCAQKPEIRDCLEIVLAGKASSEDRTVVDKSSVADLVRFADYLPHLESVQLLQGADLLFLPMHDMPAGQRATTVPGKTYEYMASGRPILAAVPDGDAKDFLSQCGTARICRPNDVNGMAQALDTAYDAWKAGQVAAKPKEDFIDQFERRNLTHRLANVFSELLGSEETSSAEEFAQPSTYERR